MQNQCSCCPSEYSPPSYYKSTYSPISVCLPLPPLPRKKPDASSKIISEKNTCYSPNNRTSPLNRCSEISTYIAVIYPIILAIRKQIAGKHSPCCTEVVDVVRIKESSRGRIIVSGLKVIQVRLVIVNVSTIAERIQDNSRVRSCGCNDPAPCIQNNIIIKYSIRESLPQIFQCTFKENDTVVFEPFH